LAYSDPGAFPFSGGQEVHADREGLAITGMRSEKIELEPGYTVSALAPWVYLKDRWRIRGGFSLPVIRDRQRYELFKADPGGARKSVVVHR